MPRARPIFAYIFPDLPRTPILTWSDAAAVRNFDLISSKRTPNQFKSKIASAKNRARIQLNSSLSRFDAEQRQSR